MSHVMSSTRKIKIQIHTYIWNYNYIRDIETIRNKTHYTAFHTNLHHILPKQIQKYCA